MQYSIRVNWSVEDGVYVARCPEFSGIAAHGSTAEEAVVECEDAISGAIQVYENEGWELPSPAFAPQYSGKLNLRLGTSLHQQVAERAQADGVSINSFLQVAVSRYLGQGTKAVPTAKPEKGRSSRKSRRGPKGGSRLRAASSSRGHRDE